MCKVQSLSTDYYTILVYLNSGSNNIFLFTGPINVSFVQDDEGEDPMLEKYKDFLFAPDELPVHIATPKVNPLGLKGTVSRKITGVKSGINRSLFF